MNFCCFTRRRVDFSFPIRQTLDPEPDVDRGRGWDRAGGYLGVPRLLHDSGSGSLIGVSWALGRC